jgi:diguanylate cyclase (GGDEF)-like protein
MESLDVLVLLVAFGGLAAATAVPFLTERQVADRDLHGYGAVVVPVLALLPGAAAVVAITLGVGTGWLVRRFVRFAPPATRSSEVASAMLRAGVAAGGGALVTAGLAGAATDRVVAAVVGGAVFVLVESVLAVAAVAVVERRPVNAVLAAGTRRGVPLETATLATGALVALAVSDVAVPAIGLLLAVVAVTTLAVLQFSADAARAHHAALVRIVTDAHASMDVAAVETAIAANAGRLVRASTAEIRDLPPLFDEAGVALPLQRGAPRWLVATGRQGFARAFSDRDRAALASVAPLAATAIENAEAHSDLSALATTDPLTGIANRRALETHAPQLLGRDRRVRQHSALLVLDIDRFKAINDDLGHAAGDAVLREVAARLQRSARHRDLVARLGGDEFAVLVGGLRDDASAHEVARRVSRALAGISAEDGRPAGISVGLAIAPEDGVTLTELYDAADARMYADKAARQGR